MPTFLPRDGNNTPIPALSLKKDGAHAIAVSASANKNTTAFDEETRVVILYATSDMYIAFGASDVAATGSDHFFPAGLYYDFSIGDEQSGQSLYISALRVNADGTLYVSEKK